MTTRTGKSIFSVDGQHGDLDSIAGTLDKRGKSLSRSKHSAKDQQQSGTELSAGERRSKRKAYVEAIKSTLGYQAYLASRAKEDTKASAAPRTPAAGDEQTSKRVREEHCRVWRNILSEWGDIPYKMQ